MPDRKETVVENAGPGSHAAPRDEAIWRRFYEHLFEAGRRYGMKRLVDALPNRDGGRGVGLATIYGKLQQSDGRHVLGVEDLVAIVNTTGDAECWTAVRKLAGLMGFAVYRLPDPSAATDPGEALHAEMTAAVKEMGDVGGALLDILEDGKVTRDEVVARLEPEILEVIAACLRLQRMAERLAEGGAR